MSVTDSVVSRVAPHGAPTSTTEGSTPVVEVPAEPASKPPRVLGVGVDLVHVPTFAEQLEIPGSRFAGVFTPGERSDIAERGGEARHWAVRWAVKEAVVKAWSTSLFGSAPVMGDEALGQIETVTDAWGRPRVRLLGAVARHLGDCSLEVSLSHDGDHAIAYVVLSERSGFAGRVRP